MFGLHQNGFGGCLADDMGLGKTLQTLTLLLKLKRKEDPSIILSPHTGKEQLNLFESPVPTDQIQPASLIVLPTSLVHNWESEINKFTPSLKVYRHVGQQRKTGVELEKAVKYYDIILTTYGTVRNDIAALTKLQFFYLSLMKASMLRILIPKPINRL